jgi:DNA-binding LacI/PurR family transcriptional regulator
MTQALWVRIARDLTAKIESGNLRPGDKLPSEIDLAEQYKVSRQTAHRAVHELKQRGLVQRQRRAGTMVSIPPAGRTKIGHVFLIVDHVYDQPQSDLIRAISSVLADDYRIVLCDVGDDDQIEASELRRAREQADGVLIYPLSRDRNTPLLQQILDEGLPLVCIDRLPSGLTADAVLSTNYESTRLGMEQLIASGHRRIAFISGDNPHVSTIRDRHQAYLDVLSEPCQDLERWFAKELEQKPDRLVRATYDALFTMLHSQNPPTAIFCTQDCYAMGVFEALDQLNPAERPVVLTFNDWPPMMLRQIPTTVRIVQQVSELGRLAAERLRRRMDGHQEPFETISVPARIYGPERSKTHSSLGSRFESGDTVTNGGNS